MDREKVIKDLEFCVNGHFKVELSLATKILAMLKEQEATMVIESENMYTGLPITHCPKCGKSLDRYLYGRQQEGEINFCPYCGKAVMWE